VLAGKKPLKNYFRKISAGEAVREIEEEIKQEENEFAQVK
jgi:hypothetical protein